MVDTAAEEGWVDAAGTRVVAVPLAARWARTRQRPDDGIRTTW